MTATAREHIRYWLVWLWLAAVLCGGGYLVWRAVQGLHFRADLMALVPQEARDPGLADAQGRAIGLLSKRVVFLVGHAERAKARAAAVALQRGLVQNRLLRPTGGGFDAAKLKAIGTVYFPYRHGLLSVQDRARLQAGQGQVIAERALAQAYGVGGVAGSGLLKTDPFLLLPGYIAGLPVPPSSLTLDDGMLSTVADGRTWILVSGTLEGEPYALDSQKIFASGVAAAISHASALAPGVQVLKTGAVFYATAGASRAMSESSCIAFFSVALTIVLLLFAFRSLYPLLLSLAVIAVGMMMAMAFSLWFWGEVHILALLFGVSLIGVTVDYSLQYFSEIYAPVAGDARLRLRRVFAGISMGAGAAALGYLLLLLAPFPGLRQIAVFSVVGLVSAWLTVVLWLPLADRMDRPRQVMPLGGIVRTLLSFWQAPRHRLHRRAAFGGLVLLCVLGAWRFHADDDVRNMQALSAPLVTEQAKIQQITGTEAESRFFVVTAKDEEMALQREEVLADRLNPLIARHALGGFQSVAGFVPSLQRQAENRLLVRDKLYQPYLATLAGQLGLTPQSAMPATVMAGLTADQLAVPLDAISLLRAPATARGVVHIIPLEGVKDGAALARAADGLDGVRLVDPARDYSVLFGTYRLRVLGLLALSALAIFGLLSLRYGVRRAAKIGLPPLIAVCTAPFLTALLGSAFTFFDVIALVLVLAMGTDYAVFFAETDERRCGVTVFAIVLSACTTIMSFGFLAFSSVQAVHNFGLTMLVGISVALITIPIIRGQSNET